MYLSEQTQDLFLNGGQIVAKKVGKNYRQEHDSIKHFALIRMPKGSFARLEGDEREFEYVIASNYMSENLLSIGTYYNGTLRDAKKKLEEEYFF